MNSWFWNDSPGRRLDLRARCQYRLMDAEAYREDARRRWEAAAGGWEKRRPVFQRGAQPVSMAMIDLLQPQPGQTVLELAAGVGDTGLLVAELVQPGGKVIIT